MRKRWIVFTFIILVLLASLGIKQFGIRDTYSQDNIRSQLDRFVEAFTYVKRYYVEPVENESLVNGAIEGMLSELDPHSVYIPKKNLEEVTERFEGYFEGIGIEFVVNNKILTVVSPIVGGPSEAVGLLPGDQIIRIEGESAYGISEDEVVKKLRGPKGSKVTVTIRRPGQSETFDVTITRDKIPIYSVIASFMMEDGKTGYIYLGRFAQTTSQELEEALKTLESRGMTQLILDLRFNSGGLLEQAIEVADKFIPGNQKLVYTKGRLRASNDVFYSGDDATHPMTPLVIMINQGSASASEIVAGAVQDLDRGLVVGQTSFGKGLVQNQIPLRDGSALRLTVARYYTPSGRLIQRPYDNGLMDYYMGAYDQTSRADTTGEKKIYYTLAGRKVYGGGGITPDSVLQDVRITRFVNQLIQKRIFFEFGSTYASQHPDQFTSFERFKDFQVTDAMLDTLKSIMSRHDIEFNKEAFDEDIDFVKTMIKAEMARHYWSKEHYYRIRISDDPEVVASLSLMSRADSVAHLHNW